MLVRVTFTSKQQKIIWQCRSLIAVIRRNIEVSWASPALVEASGTIELKEMESVIGELFEMSGVSRGEGQARAVRSFQFSFGILSAVFVFVLMMDWVCCTTCVFKYRHCLSSSQRAWFNQHCHQYPLPAYLESWTSTVTASWTRSSSSEDASMTRSWFVFSTDPK